MSPSLKTKPSSIAPGFCRFLWLTVHVQGKLAGMEDTLLNRTFRDSDGKLVIAQMPNLPLMVWLAATLLQLFFASGSLHTGLGALAFGALFTWAWQELFQGVNYFRRALGFVVLLGVLSQKFLPM